MAAAMKHMALNFVKLEKFEGVDFKRWQKKMHFLVSSMNVVYVVTTPMPEDGCDNLTVDQDTLKAKYMAEDASSKKFLVSNFTNYKITDSRPVLEQYNKLLGILRSIQHTLKHLKEELTLVELGSHLRIEEFLRTQDNDKTKGNNVAGPSVINMIEHNNSSRYNDNKGTRKHHDTKADPNKKQKVTCWKSGKPGYLKKNCKADNVGNKANGSGTKGATVHACKDRCWFKTYESLNDGSILHMGNESTALVHRRGCVDLRFSSGKVVSLLNVLHVPNIRKNLISSSVLNNCGYKQVIESNKFVLSKHDVFIGFGYLNNHMFMLNIVSDNIGSTFMSTSKLNDSILWHARLGHVHFKMMQDMSKDGLIPTFDMDTEKCKTCMLTKITKKPFQNVKCEIEVLELIHGDLCDMHATPSLGNKKYFVTFIDDASRFCYVYLLHSKNEALNKFKVFKTKVELQQGSLIKRFRTDMRGLSHGFWGEAMLTACYLLNRVPNKRNMITPYELWTKKKLNLNYLRVWGCRAVVRLLDSKLKTLGERGIECIFLGYAEHSKAFRFYVIEPNDSVAINSIIESRDAIFDENKFSSVSRPSKRSLVKGTEDSGGSVVLEKVTEEVVQQPEPELRKSKRHRTPKDFGPEFQLYLIEGTRDEVSDQHSYCFNVEDNPKTFNEAMKSQDVAFWKEAINDEMNSIMGNNTWVLADLPPGIDYFDTYALVARISTIRLLIAMTSIHNLIIHQMDVKTTFLNGELKEEVYMNQPMGFTMPSNENKVDLANGFLSSRFSMKNMGEVDVILGYHKSIVGNKLWKLDDVTSKVGPYRNMGFNESGEYKKTFIGFGIGTSSMQMLHGFEFEVEPLGDHTFEVEPQENVDQGAGLQEVQTQDLMDYQLARDRDQHLACELFGYREDNNEAAFAVAAVKKIYAHESLTFNDTVACEVISKWKAGLKEDMDTRSDVYVLSNGCRRSSDDSHDYYWEYTPCVLIHLFLYIDGMVFSCGCKAEMHSTLSLKDSLSRDCDVEKNGKWSYIYAVGGHEYQVVCTRPDIAAAGVDILDGFDRGLQTNVQVFVDFGYAMGRSILFRTSFQVVCDRFLQ
ncbi:zinc finger, CCHC-type containing protein [Tanacetum coccineum]